MNTLQVISVTLLFSVLWFRFLPGELAGPTFPDVSREVNNDTNRPTRDRTHHDGRRKNEITESRNSSQLLLCHDAQIICDFHYSPTASFTFLVGLLSGFWFWLTCGRVTLQHYIIPLTSESHSTSWGPKVKLATFVSVFVLHQCSCVLRLSPNCPEADTDICIYLFKLWLLLVMSQCSNRHFYLVL